MLLTLLTWCCKSVCAHNVLVFVSAGMPAKDLKRLAVLARGKRARFVVASPLCWGRSMMPFWLDFSHKTGMSIEINPQLFKQNHIEHVPVVVCGGVRKEGRAAFMFLRDYTLTYLNAQIDKNSKTPRPEF